ASLAVRICSTSANIHRRQHHPLAQVPPGPAFGVITARQEVLVGSVIATGSCTRDEANRLAAAGHHLRNPPCGHLRIDRCAALRRPVAEREGPILGASKPACLERMSSFSLERRCAAFSRLSTCPLPSGSATRLHSLLMVIGERKTGVSHTASPS